MLLEITWKGISETGNATAVIIGEAKEKNMFTTGQNIPKRNVDTQSSKPFEPLGI